MTRRPAQEFTREWITITGVCRAIGIIPDKSFTWSVGLEMQEKYYRAYGNQPPKENAPKSNGKGVHCFAHYPPNWRDTIEYEIKKHKSELDRQGSLFG